MYVQSQYKGVEGNNNPPPKKILASGTNKK